MNDKVRIREDKAAPPLTYPLRITSRHHHCRTTTSRRAHATTTPRHIPCILCNFPFSRPLIGRAHVVLASPYPKSYVEHWRRQTTLSTSNPPFPQKNLASNHPPTTLKYTGNNPSPIPTRSSRHTTQTTATHHIRPFLTLVQDKR